jgi:hypothetical protein
LYLVYTDETGTNFSEKSPYLLYGGLIVHESKIDVVEFQLEQIIAKFLHLEDIGKVELHTHEIFYILFYDNVDCEKKRKRRDKERCKELKEILRDVTLDDFINFTNEVIQFLAKMNIPLIVGVVNKTDEIHNEHRLNREVSAIAYSFKIFLNILDRFLATKNEKALLIADNFESQIRKDIISLPLYKRIEDSNIVSKSGKSAVKELVILRVLHESMSWKNNLTNNSENIVPLKYEFESKNFFILDNINYTNSQDSILNQVTDFILFILRKVIEINNSNNTIQDGSNLLRLVQEIDDSLLFSISQNNIILGKLYNNDIALIYGRVFVNSFKERCKQFK